MTETDKQIRVIVVTGSDQAATAQKIEAGHDVTVLTPREMGKELEKSADAADPARDVNSTSDAELGTENFIIQVVENLPAQTVAVLYDLSAADIDLLKEQYGQDFLQIAGEAESDKVAAFLKE